MIDIFTPSARKEARRAHRQEESRARAVALLEEFCRQNERFHGKDTGWRIQMDRVASRLIYEDELAGKNGLVGSESTWQHPGN